MYEEISPLIQKYLEIVDSPQNQANKKFWDNADERYLMERWRGRSNRDKHTPYTMAMDISGYSKVLDINCAHYYTDAKAHLHEQLRYHIWEAEQINCNRYFEDAAFIWFGSVFEVAWFGAKIHYLEGAAPWFDEQEHVLQNKSDLLRLPPFDFYHSGLNDRCHQHYEVMNKLTQNQKLDVMFPITMRGPFSIAIMLRGMTNLLMDFYDDPDFVHQLMATITGYLKEYAAARAKFLGEPIAKIALFNDEISTPMISNELYREFVLPYEIELSKFCNGVRYWHSCGTSQAFYESVAEIPDLQMMHIGPWSDIGKAAEVFGAKNIPLEICLTNNRDMYDKNVDEMKEQLQRIKQLCDGKVNYSVRMDGIAVLDTIDGCRSKMNDWCGAAKEVFQPR